MKGMNYRVKLGGCRCVCINIKYYVIMIMLVQVSLRGLVTKGLQYEPDNKNCKVYHYQKVLFDEIVKCGL